MKRRAFCQSSVAAAISASLPLGAFAASAKKLRIAEDLPVITLNGAEAILNKASVKDFAASLRGSVLLADSDGYEKARSIWNGMFDKRPALIAQCSGPADVMSSLAYARDNNLLLAVRAGGHSISGKSSCEGGMMIDLTQMNSVRVDPARQTARVESGALLGALDHESQRFGLATTSGTVSHTGAAGLTLGGGLGRLARLHGLTSDNLLSADIITVDGRYLRASKTENSDLFWGLRGGGGNFGIVTSFDYQLHKMGPDVLSATMMYPIEQATDVFRFVREFATTAPRELSLSAVMIMPPNGKAMTLISATYIGNMAKGEKALAPLLALGKPMMKRVGAENYLEQQRNNDGNLPYGRNYYMKSGYTPSFEDDFIDALVTGFEPSPKRNNVVIMNQLGGTIADLASDATAYAHRDAAFDLIIGAAWDDDTQSETNVQWGRDYWGTVSQYTNGFYVNNLMDEDASRIQKNYGGNYDRLVKLKNEYDPGNLLRLNANIQPTV
jgi:FAD/FMN-containing dehydrogenase